MNFKLAAQGINPAVETTLDVIRRLTGDARWQEHRLAMPHTKAFTLTFPPKDKHSLAFAYACHEIGATAFERPSEFRKLNQDASKVTMTAAFKLPSEQQWSGEKIEDRIYLRVLAEHKTTTTYEGNNPQVKESSSFHVTCDETGNIFRRNEAKFIAAYQIKLHEAPEAEPATFLSALSELRLN